MCVLLSGYNVHVHTLTKNGPKHEVDYREIEDGECGLSERGPGFKRHQPVPEPRVTTGEGGRERGIEQ